MSMSLAIETRRGTMTGWRAHLTALGLIAAAILAIFYRDAGDIAAIWWNSSTFNHCLLIPPILAWLVWQRVPELKLLTPVAWTPGLALVGLGALSWLLGEAGSVALARHLGLVFMLQGAVIACLSRDVARGLLFPLVWALFLVPVGEELVPMMQTVTAEMAMALLALSGVPAHIEGVFITTPTGYFEVAEACAGVKFLIAMAAFGTLVANVCFRAWPRRLAFVAAALIVPILANGVRAWGTIYVAHLSGNTYFAASFDHVIYGGIFFAIVIALLLGIGWPFFDRGTDELWLGDLGGSAPRRGASLRFVALAAVTIAILPPAWSTAVAAGGARPVPADFALPTLPGWSPVAVRDAIPWQPHFAGADFIRLGRYRDAGGREIDLAVAVYDRQSEGRELVGFGQGAVGPESAWAWTADAPAPPDGRAERIASHGLVREVVSFYRVGETLTGSGAAVKLETMRVRLIGGPQRAVAVLVSAPPAAAGASARPAIDDFIAALGPIDRFADRAARLD